MINQIKLKPLKSDPDKCKNWANKNSINTTKHVFIIINSNLVYWYSIGLGNSLHNPSHNLILNIRQRWCPARKTTLWEDL